MKLVLGIFTLALSSFAGGYCAKAFQKAEFSKEIRMRGDYWGKFEDLRDRHPAIDSRYFEAFSNPLYLRSKVTRFEDIPLDVSHEFRSPPARSNAEVLKRFEALSPEYQKGFLAAYNALNDEQVVNAYLKELYAETVVWSAGRRKAAENSLLFERGLIRPKNVVHVLVRRFKAKGDNKFTRITDGSEKTGSFDGSFITHGKIPVSDKDAMDRNRAFRTAVRSGPFIDDFMMKYEDHGAYAHMIQRDLVHPYLEEELGKDVAGFYEYLGSSRGIALWADLFDAGPTEALSFTRPETVSETVFRRLCGYTY